MTTVKKKLTHPLLLPYFQQKLDLKFDLLILRMHPWLLCRLQVSAMPGLSVSPQDCPTSLHPES